MDNLAAEEYVFKQGKIEGIAEGMDKGIEKEKMEIAKSMLRKGCEMNFIQEMTGLIKEVIEKLKQE